MGSDGNCVYANFHREMRIVIVNVDSFLEKQAFHGRFSFKRKFLGLIFVILM